MAEIALALRRATGLFLHADERGIQGRPFLRQRVPDLRLGGPVLPLADVVEAVGQIPRRLAPLGPHRRIEERRRVHAAVRRLDHAREMLRALPVGQALVGLRVPVGRQLVSPEQPRPPSLSADHPGLLKRIDPDVVRLRHADRVTRRSLVHPELLEPVDAEPGFPVVARRFLAGDLAPHLVDERDRRSHGHGGVVRLQHA